MKRFIFGCRHTFATEAPKVTTFETRKYFNPIKMFGFLMGPAWFDGDCNTYLKYETGKSDCMKCGKIVDLEKLLNDKDHTQNTWRPLEPVIHSLPIRFWKNETVKKVRFITVSALVVGGIMYVMGNGVVAIYKKLSQVQEKENNKD
jgi:hypothetical protein